MRWFRGEDTGVGWVWLCGSSGPSPPTASSPPLPPDLEPFFLHCTVPCTVFFSKIKVHFLQDAFPDYCHQPLSMRDSCALLPPHQRVCLRTSCLVGALFMFQGGFSEPVAWMGLEAHKLPKTGLYPPHLVPGSAEEE